MGFRKPAVVCLLTICGVTPAAAGGFLARNCANAPGAAIEIEAFNAGDANQLFPYSYGRIEPAGSATLSCTTSRCSYVYRYPTEALPDDAPEPPLGTRPDDDAMQRFAYPLPVQSDTVCFFPKYTASGQLETLSPPILHVSDCSC